MFKKMSLLAIAVVSLSFVACSDMTLTYVWCCLKYGAGLAIMTKGVITGFEKVGIEKTLGRYLYTILVILTLFLMQVKIINKVELLAKRHNISVF